MSVQNVWKLIKCTTYVQCVCILNIALVTRSPLQIRFKIYQPISTTHSSAPLTWRTCLYTYVLLDETIATCKDILYRSHLYTPPVLENVIWGWCTFLPNVYSSASIIQCTNKRTIFYKRYIGDTFVIFSSRSGSWRFFHSVNVIFWPSTQPQKCYS